MSLDRSVRLQRRVCLPLLLLLLGARLAPVAATDQAGLDFLEANGKLPDVVTLPSGLQYKVLTAGSGAVHPAVGTPCRCHYSGRLLDGTVFDSSYERGEPTTFAPNQVIKGWTEAMQKMVQGDKWELYIPSELAYGDRGSPPKIPGGSMLIFQMEIVEILAGDTVSALKCRIDDPKDCNEKELAYIGKAAAWDAPRLATELARLDKLLADSAGSVKPDLVEWMQRRRHLLLQHAAIASDQTVGAAATEL